MVDFMSDGEAQAVFHARTHEGVFIHENGFQIAHEQGVNVQLLAQAVHGHEIEMKIEFGKVEDFNRQFATWRMRGAQSVGFLPDTFLGIVWRFKFSRVVQLRFALLISSRSFSRSSRDGF